MRRSLALVVVLGVAACWVGCNDAGTNGNTNTNNINGTSNAATGAGTTTSGGAGTTGTGAAPTGAGTDTTGSSGSEQIAKTYGLDSFGQIEGIRYTFNIDLGDLKLHRAWVWEPKADRVSYDGPDKAGRPVKLTYLRSQLSSQDAVVKEEIDPAFVNDQYWLLLPLHLSWDRSAKVEETGTHNLPLAKGSARRVVVRYPAEGGYTPGDTWELFVGADNRVEEMIYRRGGSAKPSEVVATWGGYKKAGPLLISEDHRGTADGKPVRIYFSDVSVKPAGSNTWVSAQ